MQKLISAAHMNVWWTFERDMFASLTTRARFGRQFLPVSSRLTTRNTSIRRLTTRNTFIRTLPRRNYVSEPTRADDTPDIKQSPYTRDLPSTLSQIAALLHRVFKFSAIGIVLIGSASLLVFEGAQIYVENVSLAPNKYSKDSDVAHYEWDKELEDWTGLPNVGGTDPKLDWRARQALRSAWMTLHWGTSISNVFAFGDSSSYDGRLLQTLVYLDMALRSAAQGHTRLVILELQGDVVRRLGSQKFLEFARYRYQEALAISPAKDLHTAKLWTKVSDVSMRLNDIDEALKSCWRSIRVIDPVDSTNGSSIMSYHIPSRCPTSAAETRLLCGNMTRISSIYASFMRHDEMSTFYSSLLAAATNIAQTSDTQPASPAKTLHRLYLLQRVAILQLHNGEVCSDISDEPQEALRLLGMAGDTSESIALELAGSYHSMSGEPYPSGKLVIDSEYLTRRNLKAEAETLLVDASRTTASSFRLRGFLMEKLGNNRAALSNYEKALFWCGGVEGPSSNIPTKDWEAVWSDYKRLRASIPTT